MYNFLLKNIDEKYDHEFEELINVFIRPESYKIYHEKSIYPCDSIVINENSCMDKNQIKQEIYTCLQVLLKKTPVWGILTGIRPTKLAGELYQDLKSREKVISKLVYYYYLSRENAELIIDTFLRQEEYIGNSTSDSVGIYIGIPFCPTRCSYCSFTSNQVDEKEIERYIIALNKEIKFVSENMNIKKLYPESIYIGGGTPTTLTAYQLDKLITHIENSFNYKKLKEFTIEAGRPDTITKDKLDVIKAHGINRISINPQSMKDRTLELIGRSHSANDIRKAFELAKNYNFESINADIIAGLPEETLEDFEKTLNEMIEIGANNITVHTLAIKRASKLVDIDKNYHYSHAGIVAEMINFSKKTLKKAGYEPYYLYRQKHMAGALENIGFCKDKMCCVYNIRIMEERQTIIALGAGGISKAYYPKENRHERVPNVSNYEIYISRIDEMLDRKTKNIFLEDKKC